MRRMRVFKVARRDGRKVGDGLCDDLCVYSPAIVQGTRRGLCVVEMSVCQEERC